jgi:membrane protein implicated in regulation of membrane protease activity
MFLGALLVALPLLWLLRWLTTTQGLLVLAGTVFAAIIFEHVRQERAARQSGETGKKG